MSISSIDSVRLSKLDLKLENPEDEVSCMGQGTQKILSRSPRAKWPAAWSGVPIVCKPVCKNLIGREDTRTQ